MLSTFIELSANRNTGTEIWLVTGAAGFIGMHTALMLLARGDRVISNFSFHPVDVADRDGMQTMFTKVKPERVIHLVAQSGMRYLLTNPKTYIDSNLQGFANILEGCPP